MKGKIIAVLLAAALLGVSVTSCIARPAPETDAALQTSVTSPAGDQTPDTTPEKDTGETAEDTSGETTGEEGEDTSEPTTGTTRKDTAPAAPAGQAAEEPSAGTTETQPAAAEQPDQTPAEESADTTDTSAAQVADEQQSGAPASGQEDSQNTPSQPSGQGTVQTGDVLNLTNQARQDNGLTPLAESAEQAAANTRAAEIARVFSHTRPDGTSCFTAVSGTYTNLGENIAYIQGYATAQDFLTLWMGSEGHRANILSTAYKSAAIGIYYDAASNTTYAVQLFFGEAMTPAEPSYTYTDTVVAPTCTEQGYTLHTCNEDDTKSYKDTYTDALGHDWDEGTVTKAATCTAEGVKTYTCSRCTETRTEAIPAAGHQTEVRNAKEATCTEDGYTGDTVCTVCGETVTQGKAIPATGHHFEDGECTVCGEPDPDYKPGTEYTYTDTVVAPTCTEQGYTLHTCNEDDTKSYKDTYTAALGHDWDEGTVTKAATCTAEGVKTFTCSRCTETRTETIPAAGHQTEVRNAKEATCTEDGYTGDTVCTVCGETVTQGEAIPATGHHFEDGECTVCGEPDPDYKPETEYTYTDTVVAPTCTEQGYTLHTCNEDDTKSYKDNYTAALGHTWNGQNLGATCTRCNTPLFVFDHTVKPTCQDTGYDVYVSVADPSQTRRTNFTDSIDHIYENGVCTMCGAKEPGIPSYDDNYDRDYYNNAIISLTNQQREAHGLYDLKYASQYQAAADIRAQEIVSNFSHTRPDGSGPESALAALGCQYTNVGENIAYVSSMYKPGQIMDNWMASQSHASNILSNAFNSFVVGTACSNGRVYAVQLFFNDGSGVATTSLTEEDAQEAAAADPAPAAKAAPALAPQAAAEATPTPEVTPAPEATPSPEVTLAEEAEETAEATPAPEATPVPEVTPAPETTPAPEATPAPESAPAPETTPAPEATAAPEATPAPQTTPVPEATPAPEEAAAPAASSAPQEEPAAKNEEAADAPEQAPSEGQAE